MKFLLLLEKLRKEYETSTQLTENGVALLGAQNSPPLLAEHYVYPPMTERVIQHLINSYKRTIPKELLTLYRAANGMDLFWVNGYFSNGYNFPFCKLSIYGIPVGMFLQPYDISVEDLSRPDGTPDHYLKFGSYKTVEDSTCTAQYQLFVDTETSTVCSSNRKSKEYIEEEHWDSIDACLCDLFSRNRTGDGLREPS